MRRARVSPAGAPPLLAFADVSRRHSDGCREVTVLDGVSFAIEAGVAVGLYGARRSGKSTLLRLAAAIESPDAGTVRFDGRDVTRISSGERARLLRGPVALLTTADWLPSPGETVLDHVATSAGSGGLSLREARCRAHLALDRVEAAAVCGEELTASLPVRERARVMLARALVREPRLLVVDEPAPMPSPGDRERFCALLRAVAREREIALLMASEDISALQGVDVLMSIAAGELCSSEARGTVVQLPPARGRAREHVSALELREVVRHYRGGGEVVRAVDGVTLRIEAGELVALYGPSGSGKTTLLMLAAALIAPDRGSILFAGRDVARLSARESARYRRREVGLISQELHMMPGASALDNALIKLPVLGFTLREARERTRPWLQRVGLGECAERLPERLSMGERQRVAIARALVGEPGLLLADEPTGNLDSRRTGEILALLRDLCRERGIPGLLVTHDPDAISFVDHVHTLRDGHLLEGYEAHVAVST